VTADRGLLADRRAVVPLLLVAVALLVAVVASRGTDHATSMRATGEAAGLTSAAGVSPPVHRTAHPHR
jgi:hypothetical protein